MGLKDNTVHDERTVQEKRKRRKIFGFQAGQTKNCHEKIIRKLQKKGAKKVDDVNKCDVIIVFCPIVSRFETDINAALSELNEKVLSSTKGGNKLKVILVALHHTHNKEYIVPAKRQHSYEGRTIVVVHCLFFEETGLLKCPRNKAAYTTISKELKPTKHSCCSVM